MESKGTKFGIKTSNETLIDRLTGIRNLPTGILYPWIRIWNPRDFGFHALDSFTQCETSTTTAD